MRHSFFYALEVKEGNEYLIDTRKIAGFERRVIRETSADGVFLGTHTGFIIHLPSGEERWVTEADYNRLKKICSISE